MQPRTEQRLPAAHGSAWRKSDRPHRFPRFSSRASAAARSDARAWVYLISMSGRVQPATAINPPSEPPAASHRCAAVCRRRCGCEHGDSSECSPVLERLMQPVVCERLTPVPQPQCRCRSEPVPSTEPEVPVDGATGLWPERDDTTSPTRAATHDSRPRRQGNVSHEQPCRLTGPGTGLDHEPHQRLVSTVAEVWAGAGFKQCPQVVVSERLDHLGVQLGRLRPEQPVLVGFTLLDQPRREPAQRQMPGLGGGRLRSPIDEDPLRKRPRWPGPVPLGGRCQRPMLGTVVPRRRKTLESAATSFVAAGPVPTMQAVGPSRAWTRRERLPNIWTSNAVQC